LRTRRLLSATVGIILIMVVGLPTAVWVGFPALAPLLAASLLDARGIELIRLETGRPGLGGVTVDTLELVEASAGLSLRGDDIRIQWDHLLRGIGDGLASVIIGRLELVFDPPAAGSTRGATPSTVKTPTALLAGLPTRHLEITVLTATGRMAEQTFEGEGTLRAGPNDASFSGIIRADALPAPVAIRAQVRPDNQISLRVDTPQESGTFLTVDGALSQAPAEPVFAGAAHLNLDRIQGWLAAPDPWPTGILDLQLAIALDPEPRLTLAPTSTGRIELRHDNRTIAILLALAEPLGITLRDGSLSFVTGTLPVQIEARHEALAIQGDFELAAVEIGAGLGAVARLTGAGEAFWPDGSSAFTIDLPVRAELEPLRLQFAEHAELALQDLEHHQTGLAQIRVRNSAPLDLGAEGLLVAAELVVAVDDPERLELAARLRVNPAGDIAVELDEVSLPLVDNDLLAMVLPATVIPRSGRVNVEGRWQRSARGVIDATLQTRWQNTGMDLTGARVRGASGAASLSGSSDMLRVASATTLIDRLEWINAEGPQTMILFEGLEGSGSGTLAVDFDTGLTLGDIALNAKIASRAITRGEIAAQEVEVDARISGDARQPNIEGRLRMASAALGVPVNDVSCRFDSADLEVWQLSECSAAVLGGEVRLPRGDFDLATGSGYLPLAVTGLQLSAVLGLMQDPALDGTGTLDGSLPLRLKAMQPAVEQGWLAVRPPGGVLAYATAATVLAGIEQPALRLTLRAVRDLRYQRLESRVDYSEDGILTLTVDLLGSNPEIEGGRPIQLNLNVTQNLLELLQSLRFSDDIEQELQRRMQRVQP